MAAAEPANNAPCVLLVKAGESYTLGLTSLNSDSELQIVIQFNHTRDLSRRLQVSDSYYVENDLLTTNVYYIRNESTCLCTIKYVGLEQVLLGEERARLEVTSEGYLVYLVGVQPAQQVLDLDIPESFRIIVALCSLVPFFLLIPDGVEEIQTQFDTELMSRGVYAQILALLLPFISIGLTFLLLGGLDVFR
jgi:hypothetical protein